MALRFLSRLNFFRSALPSLQNNFTKLVNTEENIDDFSKSFENQLNGSLSTRIVSFTNRRFFSPSQTMYEGGFFSKILSGFQKIYTREKTEINKELFILTIDGGGMRGVVPIHVCQLIENITGKRIAEIFDLLVGTSTGSIICFGYALKGDATGEIMLEQYKEMGEKIFEETSWYYFLKNYAWYDAGNLESVLATRFGESTLRTIDALSKIKGPKFYVDEKLSSGEKFPHTRAAAVSNYLEREDMHYLPFLFRLYDSPYEENESTFYSSLEDMEEIVPGDVKITDILLASCAAPTYFEAKKIGDYFFVDGGISNNNPTYIAYWEAKKLFPQDDNNYNIVSLGTGRQKFSASGGENKSSILEAKDIYYNTLSQVDTTDKQMQLIQSSHEGVTYIRVNPSLAKDITMTSTKDEDMKYLGDLVKDYLCSKEGVKSILMFLENYRKKCIKEEEEIETINRLDYFIEELDKALEIFQTIENTPYYINRYRNVERLERNLYKVRRILFTEFKHK